MTEDPFHVPELDDHELNNWLLQYCENIDKAGKTSVFWICRRRDCLYMCQSTDWADNTAIGSAHYWCPICAHLYEPWVQSQQRVKANKVMVYKLDDLKQEQTLKANAVASNGERFRVVPYMWLDTVGQNIEDRFKRVASGIMEEIKKVPPADRLNFVLATLEKKAVHALLEHHVPTEEQKQAMIAKNKLSGPKQPKGAIDLAKHEKGSYGRFMKQYVEQLDDPVTETAMMRNWICAKVSCMNAMRLSSL